MTAPGALVADEVVKRFGGLVAVDHLSITVQPGELIALIGPNGAGKTTFFNCLTGLLEPDGGRIRLGDDDVTSWDTHRRAQAGVGRTFQRLQVFTRMTVRQNLQVAAEATDGGGIIRSLFSPGHRTSGVSTDTIVGEVLERLGLDWCASRLAGDLPTGVLRLVELGRALCTRPHLLLLDEPASGLDATESEQLAGVLRAVAGEGIGILLVEHDVRFVLSLAERVHVMDFGRLIASGPPDEIAADPAVRTAYLGTVGAGA